MHVEAFDQLRRLRNQSQYDGLSIPKRMVLVKGAGHATFLDRCQAIFAAGGLGQRAGASPELDALLQGSGDGCEPGNTDPAVAAALVNHVMIAQYRVAFGEDRTDVSLDPAYLARTFPLAFGSEQVAPPQETLAPAPPTSIPGALTPTTAP